MVQIYANATINFTIVGELRKWTPYMGALYNCGWLGVIWAWSTHATLLGR